MRKFIVGSFLLLRLFSLEAKDKNQIFELNARLGRGINIGNTFEAPSEDAWGNPWNPEYVKMIADLGFSHIRVPIRWEVSERTMTEPPYTVSGDFLERIKGVVDIALAQNLHIIINMHHHESLFTDPKGERARFLSQWRQIADYFKTYPDSLLFEILNEPHDMLTAEQWNVYFKEALAEIRQTNPTRGVLVGTAEWGGVGGLRKLEWPDDDHLILTVHYYNPFEFTHQGADWSDMEHVSGVEWNDTEMEREAVRQDFMATRAFASKHNVPVHVGEFGAYQVADLNSRVRWTTFLARFFDEQGYSWAYWEFSAGFGIYNPLTGEFLQPLIDALLHNPMPDPISVKTTVIYESDFAKSGADDWFFQSLSGAQGSMSVKEDALNLDLLLQGSNTWDLQLMKLNVPVEKEQQYRVSFKASSTQEGWASSYIGRKISPWDAYSPFFTFPVYNQEETYLYVFTMHAFDDAQARIVFDLGALPAPATVTVRDVKLEKIEADDTSNGPDVLSEAMSGKSPAFAHFDADRQVLIIRNNACSRCKATVYSMMGTVVFSDLTEQGTQSITANHWQPGTYVVVLETNGTRYVRKIIK